MDWNSKSSKKAHAPAAPAPVKDPVTGPAVLADVLAEIMEDFPETRTRVDFTGSFSPTGKTAAVILGGGRGDRFGTSRGKQLYEIHGRPVLSWSITAFDGVADIGLIVVVCHPDRIDEYVQVAIEPFNFATPIVVVPGGEFRQESAFNGVAAVPSTYEFIAVHDGARPVISPELIEHTINVVQGSAFTAGAVVGHPAVDTLKIVESGYIMSTPDRGLFWIAQTPQIFRADILRRAYSAALAEGFVGTDDSSLVERLNETVLTVNGPRDNIKITLPEDADFAAASIKKRIDEMGNFLVDLL